MLRVVGTAMRPTPGSLVLDSVDPWALPRAALRRLRSRIGTIHQAPPLPLPFSAKSGTLHQDKSVTYDKKCRTRVTRFHGVFAPNSNHRGRVTPNGTVLVAVDLTVVPGRKSALGSGRSPGSGGGDSGPPPRRLPNRQLTASWRP